MRVSRDQGLDKTHKMLAALILSLVVQPKLAKRRGLLLGLGRSGEGHRGSWMVIGVTLGALRGDGRDDGRRVVLAKWEGEGY